MKKFIVLFFLIIILIFLYGKFIEPNNLAVHEYSIHDNKIPENIKDLKVIQFSDLYYNGENNKQLEKVVKEINHNQATIVIFTGDLLKNNLSDEKKTYLIQKLKEIEASHMKLAILGDHDDDNIQEILNKSGFMLLDKDPQYYFNNDITPIQFINGLAYEPKEDHIQDAYTIALIHEPDNFDSLENKYNLVLAGHSLGGYVNMPFYGSLIQKKGAKKYNSAYHLNNDSKLYISNGIGTEKVSFRLFNTPSINIFRFYHN